MKYKHMKDNENKSPLRYIPAFVFIGFIFILGILFIVMPKSSYSSTEKRYLQEFPEFSARSVFDGDFTEGFENYLADHFFGRNFWMGFNSYYNLITGRNGADGVYNCSDGYLINVPVSKSESRLQDNINSIVNFSKNTDIPITVEIAPSTGYIMNDKLPKNHFEYNDDFYFSQLIDTCGKNNIQFIDLRESFKELERNNIQLYYKTDHHWTTEGAYAGYTRLCEEWGIKPSGREEFDIKQYDGFYGTTYSTSGFWLTAADSIQVWNNPKNEGSVTLEITEGDESNTYRNMYFLNHLEEDDKYPIFLDGNHAMEKIVNSNVKSGKLLIIKDSFSHCFAPFLADNFNEVTLVDLRYYKSSISQLAAEEKYDKILVLYGLDNFATDTDLAWLK